VRLAAGPTSPCSCPADVELACNPTFGWLSVSRPRAGVGGLGPDGWSDVLAACGSGSPVREQPRASGTPAPAALPPPAAAWPVAGLAAAFPVVQQFGPPAARRQQCAGAAVPCA